MIWNPASHASDAPITKLVESQRLFEHPRWLALGHYRKTFFGGYKSDIHSDDFFLSINGKTDPRGELNATLLAFSLPVNAKVQDQHAQCRFPARLLWLRQVLPLPALPKVDCQAFKQFSYQGGVESISVVFATGYLSNPASYFGHPLIKFNLSRVKIPNNLLDVSVNYGAVTPPEENPFIYAAKGLFGGYFGTFTNRQFYYSNHAYAELELRDMWEYKLNLSRDEVDQIVSHTWEVMGKKFTYFFTSNNCASAMAQILTDVMGVRLDPAYLPYSIPYMVFDNLAHKQRPDGSPLITSVTLIPSRQSRLTGRYSALSSDEKSAVRSIAQSNSVTDQYRTLPEQSKIHVIETLFDYFAYRAVADPDTKSIGAIRYELLSERLRLPTSAASDPVLADVHAPHEGQSPVLTRIGVMKSVTHGEGAELRLRLAYYDFLALDIGRPPNSSVRSFDAAFVIAGKKAWLRSFDFISIEALNLSQTGLPGDGGYAWKFNTGFETQNLACTDCEVFKIESGIGKAISPVKRQILYVMLDGRMQTLAAGGGHFAATPNIGAIFDLLSSGAWKGEATLGYRDYFDDHKPGQPLIRLENRFGRNRSWDIRLAYEKHVDEQTKLSFSYYW